MYTDIPVREVSEFPAPRENPLSYPGKRPRHSFVTDGALVFPVTFEAGIKSARMWMPHGSDTLLDNYLKMVGVAPLGERFPVMGYGSNACPGQLKSKFPGGGVPGGGVIPVINGNIAGWDAVYNFMSRFGYAFAELMPQRQTGLDVTVTLLDEKQLSIMNSTEPNYVLSVFPKLAFETGEAIDALGYAGVSAIFVSSTHQSPVALREITARNRKLPELYQRELLELAVRELDLGRKYSVSSAEELSALVRSDASGDVIKYIKAAIADGRSLSKSTAELVKQEPNPSKPRKSLDDLLRK